MPMNPDGLKSKLKERIYNGLKKEFSSSASKGADYQPVADEYWEKLATAISGIAADIVMEITQNAEVLSGIQVVGAGGGVPGPMSGATVSPGKIM